MPGRPGKFIFLAGRWNQRQFEDSRYVRLPFQVGPGDTIELKWLARWQLP
jgi:hypothetical protein